MSRRINKGGFEPGMVLPERPQVGVYVSGSNLVGLEMLDANCGEFVCFSPMDAEAVCAMIRTAAADALEMIEIENSKAINPGGQP